jgi:hypothetical protein
MWSSVILDKLTASQIVKEFSFFNEPRRFFLPLSLETVSYSEPVENNLHLHNLLPLRPTDVVSGLCTALHYQQNATI